VCPSKIIYYSKDKATLNIRDRSELQSTSPFTPGVIIFSAMAGPRVRKMYLQDYVHSVCNSSLSVLRNSELPALRDSWTKHVDMTMQRNDCRRIVSGIRTAKHQGEVGRHVIPAWRPLSLLQASLRAQGQRANCTDTYPVLTACTIRKEVRERERERERKRKKGGSYMYIYMYIYVCFSKIIVLDPLGWLT
jgi:hypothetical protein